MNYYEVFKPLLYSFSPETAHNLAIFALKNGVLPKQKIKNHASTQVSLLGMNFTNPVGLAAGFDKNGDAISGLCAQGFGFVEVGTVTPKPQSGNAKPRLFRLEDDEAVINRFGFNNKGSDHFVSNLKNRPAKSIVGANIGKNKESTDAMSDYMMLMDAVYGLSDYITVNISSPNTPGLRNLQNKDELDGLLKAIRYKADELAKMRGVKVPVLLKLAPDTSLDQREDIAALVIIHKIDGLIISNTTIGRDGLKSKYAGETGGLSGRPVMEISTAMVKDMYRLTAGKMPIIGAGGIFSGEDAYKKIRAGASLVQVYSALVYKGFGLVEEINNSLAVLLEKDGFKHISEAVGVDANLNS